MSSQSRPLANFSPDIWGDKFTSISRDVELWQVYSEERDALKNEVRSMLESSGRDWTDKVILINTIERLGVCYHFSEYIENLLEEMHDAHAEFETYENYDLFTTALCFRIFRQHGYNVPSEIFNKYIELDGKFNEAITKDPMGLLSLYEAAHLRIHEEAILDEALAFTTFHLKSMQKTLGCGSLARQVRRALDQPLHKGIPRIEARHFVSFYEDSPTRNDVLLKFAKLDFNLLQMLYRQELSQVNRWWADLDFNSKYPQFRSRVVEGYLWAVGGPFQPCYAMARIMYTKVLCALSVSDDLYDAYGTMEELDLYTKAIERLDVDSVDGLPDHCEICYITLLNILSEFDEQLVKKGSYYDVSYLKEVACPWATSKPKAVVAAETMGRIINDIFGYEEHNRPHVATSIDCYTKEFKVSKEEAVAKLYEMIEDTWKDINEECLRPTTVAIHNITLFLQVMRICHVTYNDGDGYTHPEKHLEHEINLILADPLPI